MGPSSVIDKIIAQGISIFAITDHNSTRNCRAFMDVASTRGVRCIPGIEVTSSEEAHILCYFDSLLHAERFGERIAESLLPFPMEESMGMQVVVNYQEEIEDIVANYLGIASSYTISEIVELAHANGGIVIPAHIDKPVFSIISQLGFMPDDPFDAVEISYGCLQRGEQSRISFRNPIISGSDAHYLDDIGRVQIQLGCEMNAPLSEILSSLDRIILSSK